MILSEVTFSRRNATGISAAELRRQLAEKLEVRVSKREDGTCLVLGDLNITVSLAFGADQMPVSADVQMPGNVEGWQTLALFRVFQTLGWECSRASDVT